MQKTVCDQCGKEWRLDNSHFIKVFEPGKDREPLDFCCWAHVAEWSAKDWLDSSWAKKQVDDK